VNKHVAMLLFKKLGVNKWGGKGIRRPNAPPPIKRRMGRSNRDTGPRPEETIPGGGGGKEGEVGYSGVNKTKNLGSEQKNKRGRVQPDAFARERP